MQKWIRQYWFEIMLVFILYWLAPYFGIFVGLIMLICWFLNNYPPRS